MNCMNFVTILSLCIPNYIKYFISELLNFLLDFTILHMKIFTKTTFISNPGFAILGVALVTYI